MSGTPTPTAAEAMAALNSSGWGSAVTVAGLAPNTGSTPIPSRVVLAADSIIRAQAARIAELEEERAWRPIETAPENMTTPVVVFWLDSDSNECHDFDCREDGCWMRWHNHAEHTEVIGGHGVSYTPPYTGWMPLPATKAPADGEG